MPPYARHLAASAAFLLLLTVVELAGTQPGNAQDTSADARIAALEAQVRNLQAQITNMQAQLINQQAALNAETSARKQGESDVLAAAKAITDRQVATVADKIAHFSRNGNEVFITGANLHLVNGAGTTETTNSLGNLIVGYNESRPDGTDNRTGSHNLVVGKEHNFTSFGGFLAGIHNTASGAFASVKGGSSRVAAASNQGNSGNTQVVIPKNQDPAVEPGTATRPQTAKVIRSSAGSSSSAVRRKSSNRNLAYRRSTRKPVHKSAPTNKPAARPKSSPGRPPGR